MAIHKKFSTFKSIKLYVQPVMYNVCIFNLKYIFGHEMLWMHFKNMSKMFEFKIKFKVEQDDEKNRRYFFFSKYRN